MGQWKSVVVQSSIEAMPLWLKGFKTNLVIADIPYNLSVTDKKWLRKVRPYSPFDFDKGDWDHIDNGIYASVLMEWFNALKLCMTDDAFVAVFTTHHCEPIIRESLLKVFGSDMMVNRIIWWKNNPSPLVVKSRLVWSYEMIYVFRKTKQAKPRWDRFDKKIYDYTDFHDVWQFPICQGNERLTEEYIDDKGKKRRKSLHKTQKPIRLINKLIDMFLPKSIEARVLDAFSGSGTTLSACLGRDDVRFCLAVDNDPYSIKLIEKRVSRDYSKLNVLSFPDQSVEDINLNNYLNWDSSADILFMEYKDKEQLSLPKDSL